MKILNTRQQGIVDLVKEKGHVDVEGLSEHFQVTPQTIRRDLNELCEHKFLGRIHGGAVHLSNVANMEYNERRHIAENEKQRIGKAAAALIPNNASIILNIGTTTEQVAHALRDHSGLMAITNNLNIANILIETLDTEVLIAGGMARRPDGGIVGAATVDFIRQFKVDYAIVGTSGIDEDGSLLDFDYREVRVSKVIMEQARHVILVSDSTKFERKAPVCIGHLTQIDTFVTDVEPPKAIQELCAAHDVTVIIAPSLT